MSTCESNPPAAACPPTVEDLRRQAHERARRDHRVLLE